MGRGGAARVLCVVLACAMLLPSTSALAEGTHDQEYPIFSEKTPLDDALVEEMPSLGEADVSGEGAAEPKLKDPAGGKVGEEAEKPESAPDENASGSDLIAGSVDTSGSREPAAEEKAEEPSYLFYLVYEDIQARTSEMPGWPATDEIEKQQLVDDKVYLAKNEREAFQIFYREQDKERNLSIQVSPFTNSQGETLQSSLYNEAFFNDFADALVPYAGEPVQTRIDENNMFYLELHATKNQTPGAYAATVSLCDGDQVLERRSVVAKVWDFELPENRYSEAVMGLYNQNSGYGATSGFLRFNGVRFENGDVAPEDEALAKEILAGYQEVLIDHGVSTYEIPRWLMEDDPKRAELTMADPRRKVFVVPATAWDMNGTAFSETAQERILQYKELAYDNPFLKDKAFFYPLDEPFWESASSPFENSTSEIERLWPGAHMVVPFYRDYDTTVGMLEGKTDIFCPNQHFFVNQQTIDDVQQGPWDRVWRYPGDNLHGGLFLHVYPVLATGTMRRVMSWQQYLLETDGILFWNCAITDQNYWDTMTLPNNGDGILLYPGAPIGQNPTVPIVSLRLKQFASGLDDYDYLKLAEEFIGPDFAESRALDILYGGKDGDLTQIISKEGGFTAWSCMDMVRVRIALGDALERADTSHAFGPWEKAVEGDETHDGLEIRTCTTCATQESRPVPYAPIVSVTVDFDANGGEGTAPSLNPIAGEEVYLSTNTFVRLGYDFIGWNTRPDGSGVSYPDGGLYVAGSTNETLFAQWAVQVYAVKFAFLGTEVPQGVAVPQVVSASYGTTIEEPKFSILSGWTFDGWYLDQACIQRFDFSNVVSEEMTLYGRWSYRAPAVDQPSTPPASGAEQQLSSFAERLARTDDALSTKLLYVLLLSSFGVLCVIGALRLRRSRR